MTELNLRAKDQPGYLSTVTLQSTEDSEDYIVISQWETADAWKRWFVSKERRDIQSKVDSLIGNVPSMKFSSRSIQLTDSLY